MSLPKVSVIGAGNVGATTSHILLTCDLADVVMVDVVPGVAEGKAMDMMHMRGNEGFQATVLGYSDYSMTQDSDIVVVTAGVPRKPGMTREDLLNVNAGIVRSVLDEALPRSPEALYLFVTNPMDVMVNYAYQLSSLPKGRVFGMGGVLDTARFVTAVCSCFGCQPNDVEAIVIGAHGEAMLPLPRLVKVKGQALTELADEHVIEDLVNETINGGAAIVELLQTGSAYYAPASAIVTMVAEILHPTGRVLPVSAGLEGEYGLSGVHLGVPVRLGPGGVEGIIELDLHEDEYAALANAASSITEQLSEIV
ncbi:MAG: malate dehydrogenase [Coriobacteriia bacterium]|nr:malate dehydrogenase [Coriobacteriia bacterium]